MKVVLDTARCTGHALCNAAAPEVFDLDDQGYCLLPGGAVLDVPDEQQDAARAGVEACPEQALELRD